VIARQLSRFLRLFAACFALNLAVAAQSPAGLPPRLTDPEFWTLVADLSEPNGNFRSENLLSNEVRLQSVIPNLMRVAKPGRVYMGVGPEQNFTYIAAVKPSMAFIIDIRRGNLNLHLIYKALFELSADRREFVSRLFSRPTPQALTDEASASELFGAFAKMESDEARYRDNLAAIKSHLMAGHAFTLSEQDLADIENIYQTFFQFGPSLRYSNTGGAGPRTQPSYADLMMATDFGGQSRGFLSNEDNFRLIRDLESRNLVVPIVGDFAGPTSIRAVGAYVRDRGALVSAFYLSNVEQYLKQDQVWGAFCSNVATLPVDDSSMFIRATFARGSSGGFLSELGRMMIEVEKCRIP
jgi:hypothetical protein